MKKLLVDGKTISEHLKTLLEQFKSKMLKTWEWVKNHKKEILITLGITVGTALGVYALSSTTESEEDDYLFFEAKDYNTYGPQDYEPVEPHEPRYLVERKAFKTGEWYTKTATDWKPAAFSVAKDGGWGRATRLIDRETGEILFESKEAPGMKELNEACGYNLTGIRPERYHRDKEALSVDDAALIWASNGMDEDYDFGYTEDELLEALHT